MDPDTRCAAGATGAMGNCSAEVILHFLIVSTANGSVVFFLNLFEDFLDANRCLYMKIEFSDAISVFCSIISTLSQEIERSTMTVIVRSSLKLMFRIQCFDNCGSEAYHPVIAWRFLRHCKNPGMARMIRMKLFLSGRGRERSICRVWMEIHSGSIVKLWRMDETAVCFKGAACDCSKRRALRSAARVLRRSGVLLQRASLRSILPDCTMPLGV